MGKLYFLLAYFLDISKQVLQWTTGDSNLQFSKFGEPKPEPSAITNYPTLQMTKSVGNYELAPWFGPTGPSPSMDLKTT